MTAAPAGPTILVVDDEEALCEVACIWLASMGYRPVGVHAAAPALAHLERQKFDVLFTDIVMPGEMDGIALARAALALQPGLRVLLTSGYAQNIVDRAGRLPGPLITKPYRKPQLEAALGSLLAAR